MAKTKKTKYDTNPLDPDYARRSDEEFGRADRAEEVRKEPWRAEAPTMRYASSIPVSYPSINVPRSYPPAVANRKREAAYASKTDSSERKVAGLGLSENLTYALPYAPFFIGAIVGTLELFFTPRHETKARFHAAQGVALHLASVVLSIILSIIGEITGNTVGRKLFWVASTVLFIIGMVRVWKGETVHIAAADDAAQWLNDRIGPKAKK